ncbi:hypothetical protein GPALN_007763 [Globodera pallida]|nr:hypothetical protein GPALN_007763 [Globodera pallida]
MEMYSRMPDQQSIAMHGAMRQMTTSLKLDDRVRRSVSEHATLHTDATHIVGTLTVGALIAAIVTVDDQQFMEKAKRVMFSRTRQRSGHVLREPTNKRVENKSVKDKECR